MSTALRLEGHRAQFESASGISGKAEEGCGNTDTPSGTVRRGGRRGEVGAGGRTMRRW
jgi:hypothetical protein